VLHHADCVETPGGTQRTIAKDLDQAWRLYTLHTLVLNAISSLHIGLRRTACANLFVLVVHMCPGRVWLFVKQRRWMLSDEYAKLQEEYIGTDVILAARTKALLQVEPEDRVIFGRSHPSR
jgi:hypothetical protein